MGDFDLDTRVEGAEGRYRAALSEDWAIWGPNGGYVAAILFRAAGTHATLALPASLSVQFLARGEFDEVQLEVRTLRRTRRAEAVAVSMRQGDRTVAEGLAWFVDEGLAGLDHDATMRSDVASPHDTPTMQERLAEVDDPGPPFPFWDNFEYRPIDWRVDWPPPGPLDAVSESWFRFSPTAAFADPLVEAGRLIVVLDTMGWPAATGPHAWQWKPGEGPWVAPSLDLYVQFHRPGAAGEYILCRADAPLGEHGLIATESRARSEDGTLLASGYSQLLCTPVRPPG